MNETARENLRKGMDLFWKAFSKKKNELRGDQRACGYLEKVESELNRAEALFLTEQFNEAADVAIQAGNLLSTIDFRLAVALFREANRLQQSKNPNDKRINEFGKRATHLLDQAEEYLGEDKIDEAKTILLKYHREKVMLGLAGPPDF